MKIEIKDKSKINIFTQIFKHLKPYGENFNLMFESNRFYTQGMDEAHISLFEIILVDDWFDTYEVEEDTTIGININILYQVLNIIKDDHTLILTHPIGGDKINIHFEGTISQEFSIPLVDLDTELLQVPEVEWGADLGIQTKLLKELMSEQNIFGDLITFTCSETKINMASDNNLIGRMETNINIEDLDEYAVEEDVEISVTYSLKYILYMTAPGII